MHRIWALRPSPAMAVALLALFVSLGGSAYATFTLSRNSVGTAQLKRGAVTNAKVHRLAIGTAKIRNRSVTNAKLTNPSLRINAGRGLAGGGAVLLGGSGTLSVNSGVIQNRVSGICSGENAISSINQNGSVGCQLAAARDVGAVNTGPTPSFRPEELRGWRAVTRLGTGQYCLTSDPASSTSNSVVLVSAGNVGGGQAGFVAVLGSCGGPHDFSIDTYDIHGNLSNSVQFTAVIPN